jgi:hypothetical protein
MRLNYITELNSLVRSVVLKSSHQAEAINKWVVSNYGVNAVSNDYKTWRYYLNLAGEPHFTNTPMEVYVMETNNKQPLNKELLEKYKKTRDDLSRHQNAYKELVSEYPNNESLIRGMINPVDMDVAYNAKNGAVLAYSNYYADVNDRTVMKKLSKYTESLYYRWFNAMYLDVEEYYLHTFLAFLYSNLYTKIDLIRMENIHTHKAHIHHIEQFFMSNLDIDTRYLNNKSKMWLYQNLRAIMTNMGQIETFKQILDNVITPNEIGVGKVTVMKTKPFLIDSSNSLKENFTTDTINQLIVSGLNEYYNLDGMSISEVTSMEINNGYIHETQYMDINELVDRVKAKIDQNNELETDTKVIHLLGKEDRDILPFPRINMVLDNLFHIASKSICEFNIRYVDNSSNTTYTITMSQAIRLLAYHLLKLCNVESVGGVIRIGSNSVFAINDINVHNLFLNDGSDYSYISRLESTRPSMYDEYFNSTDVVEYINKGIDYFIDEWLVKSSLLNQVSIANMDVVNKHKCSDEFELLVGDITREIGITIPEKYNYLEAIKNLIYVIGNGELVLSLSEVNMESIQSYVDLLSKTTSYNLQIVGSSKVGDSLHIFDIGWGELDAPPTVTINGYTNGLEDLVGDLEEGIVPTVTGHNVSGNSYLHMSDMTPMNGLATDESVMLKGVFKLKDYNTKKEIYSNIYSDNKYLHMSDMTPMNGLATDESVMLKGISKVSLFSESNVFSTGGTYKLELKK